MIRYCVDLAAASSDSCSQLFATICDSACSSRCGPLASAWRVMSNSRSSQKQMHTFGNAVTGKVDPSTHVTGSPTLLCFVGTLLAAEPLGPYTEFSDANKFTTPCLSFLLILRVSPPFMVSCMCLRSQLGTPSCSRTALAQTASRNYWWRCPVHSPRRDSPFCGLTCHSVARVLMDRLLQAAR